MSRQLSGMNAWLIQRVSALYIAGFVICWAVASLFGNVVTNYEQWRSLWSSPIINLATLLFFVALLLHAWVGARDVILDYLHSFILRLTALCLVVTGFIICGLWAMRVLLNAL